MKTVIVKKGKTLLADNKTLNSNIKPLMHHVADMLP